MASYQAPLQEIRFVLDEILQIGRLVDVPAFAELGGDTIHGAIEEAAKLMEEQLAPLHRASDQGCTWDNGEVRAPAGYREFYQRFQQGGWMGIAQAAEYGGSGFPYLVGKVIDEMTCSANVAFALYPTLTTGCFEAIEACGDAELHRLYCAKLATGEWAGTMCLTEPQAGSDVGAIKTRALPQPDGSYRIEGNKIFISSGEHDLTENIVHLVLARMPDSPPGVRGLSTFVVPKFLLKADGTPGERNAVRCLSIEHKMGLHGSCTCALAFENAQGWLVGEPNQGIQNMFVMMNFARIGVGVQGLGQCELATQNAIRYAKERKQGRSESGSEFIVDHPDVRRMLLHMKAITEGARVLAYETSMYVDLARHHPDAAVREEAQDWVDLGTPLTKAFCTDSGFDLASLAVQVYGGHGYVQEYGVEQIVRDAKIFCIYEGTNGIQALDLVRRKLGMRKGRLPRRFFDRLHAALDVPEAQQESIWQPLTEALAALEAATAALQGPVSAEDGAFGSTDYLRAFALTWLGYNWLRMAQAARRHHDARFTQAKLATADYFATRVLSSVPSLCANAVRPASALMALAVDAL
ncbi:MAG: acyl-CoA dehydrogenase family protein [Panacagrimonas sp.]